MTKHSITYIQVIFLVVASLLPSLVFAQATEVIDDFTAHIEINRDGTVVVQEEILYNFGETARHGIFRDIPIVYNLPNNKEGFIELANISVTDETGKTLDVSTDSGNNFFQLKIGDPKTTITGQHLYVIKYTVYGAINFLPITDELYWNVTGSSWPVPITRTRIEVVLPQEFDDNEVTRSCYSGAYGSTNTCETGVGEGSATGTVSSVRFLKLGLQAKEGITVAVGVPKGVISSVNTGPAAQAINKKWWKDLTLGFTFLIPLLGLFFMYRRWKAYGKDPEKSAILTNYDAPPGISVLRASIILTGSISGNAISAQIIDLARRGFLSIAPHETPSVIFATKTFKLTRTTKLWEILSKEEQMVLRELFPENAKDFILSTQQSKLAKLRTELDTYLSSELVTEGLYATNPQQTRGAYIMSGVGLIIFGFIIQNLVAFGLIITGIIIMLFGWLMPRLTDKGAEIRDELLGLKEYINIAESDRIAFHNNPKFNTATFETLLPFAMLFGLEKAWATIFDELYATDSASPKWYGGHFSPAHFTSATTGFVSSANSAYTSGGGASGGGGSSGGGRGGGGGGSW